MVCCQKHFRKVKKYFAYNKNLNYMKKSLLNFLEKNVETCMVVIAVLIVLTGACHYLLPIPVITAIIFVFLIILFGFLFSFYFFREAYKQIESGKAKKAGYELLYSSKPDAVARNFVFFIAMILLLPLIFTRPALFDLFVFKDTGPIGDTFGGIMGPFIAMLAAWLTYKAFVMQYDANQDIRVSSAKNRFETNFFQLLNLQQKITEDLILYTKIIDDEGSNGANIVQRYKHVKLRGREAIRQIYDKGTNEKKLKIGDAYIDYGGVLYNIGIQGYNYMAENDDLSFLDHYFRHLYRIIKYVDDHKNLFTLRERYEYVCLLRAQLSDYELGLVFYNCLSDNGRDKFKPLAEKYALFNNIRYKVLNNPELDIKEYDNKAFDFDENQEEEACV